MSQPRINATSILSEQAAPTLNIHTDPFNQDNIQSHAAQSRGTQPSTEISQLYNVTMSLSEPKITSCEENLKDINYDNRQPSNYISLHNSSFSQPQSSKVNNFTQTRKRNRSKMLLFQRRKIKILERQNLRYKSKIKDLESLPQFFFM